MNMIEFSELKGILNSDEPNNLIIGNGFSVAYDSSFSGISEISDTSPDIELESSANVIYKCENANSIGRVEYRQNNGFTEFYKKICNAQRRNEESDDGKCLIRDDEVMNCASFLRLFQNGKIFMSTTAQRSQSTEQH